LKELAVAGRNKNGKEKSSKNEEASGNIYFFAGKTDNEHG
jgi:hypothetical protein